MVSRLRPIAASIRSNSAPTSPERRAPAVVSSALGMSVSIISPDAGSPAGPSRGTDGEAKGSLSVDASQFRNASSVAGSSSRAGSGRSAGAFVRGLSQSRGSSPTITSTPACSHHESALAAQSEDMMSFPRKNLAPLSRRSPGWSIV